MEINEYWHNFLKENNLSKDSKYIEAFSFGRTPKQNDELLKLVLEGKKVATTSPYIEEEVYGNPNDYSIVLDSKGEPRCIIKTTKTRIMAFKDMTYDICKLEGEDEVLDTWIENHVAFLKESCDEYGYQFSFDMPIVFEEFEVVYK